MDILQKIIAHKTKEVQKRKENYIKLNKKFEQKDGGHVFYKALAAKSSWPRVIAEIKPRSPSAEEVMRPEDTVEDIAQLYTASGVAAISVLTDEKFFGASLLSLKRSRNATTLPLLMKDFVIDEMQIREAAEFGANAVLLMRSVLDTKTLQKFLDILETLGMDGLTEVHDREELLDVVRNTSAKIIGVNNRNLKTLEVNPENFEKLLADIPEELQKDRIFVCESGLGGRYDLRKYARHADAVLVGTGILQAEDRSKILREFFGKPEVKICGITNPEDALAAGEKADYLGFIFAENSPRRIAPHAARQIAVAIRQQFSEKAPKIVGVFVNPSLMFLREYGFLDVLQLHGEESAGFCVEIMKKFPDKQVWKAIRLKNEEYLNDIREFSFCDAVLIDSFSEEVRGGTGKEIPLSVLEKVPWYLEKGQRFFVAGGVSEKNVGAITETCWPDGIDVSSSLEGEVGRKDGEKMERFFEVVKNL